MICPGHFKQIKSSSNHNRVNVTWCFVCCETGELIGCSRCPAAYHASCLKSNDSRYINKDENKQADDVNPKGNAEATSEGKSDVQANSIDKTLASIDKENWLCEDCLINKRPLYGEIVWAKVGK